MSNKGMHYDPVMCMMVENGVKTNDAVYSVGYKHNGVFQAIGVVANSESEAVQKFKRHLGQKASEYDISGASIGESLETMRRKGKPVIDEDPDCEITNDATEAYKGYYIQKGYNGYYTIMGNDFKGKVYPTSELAKREIRRKLGVKDRKIVDEAIRACKMKDTHWTEAYKKFTDIVDKYFPDERRIEMEVRNLYNRNKNNPGYVEAWKRWNDK